LGGPDRRTLFVCAASDWKRDEVLKAPTGVILAIDVETSGVGRP
jgi:sugar lactone lactonase YvrE